MTLETEAQAGTVETAAQETQGDPKAIWKLWMESIELASKEEDDFRKRGLKVMHIYAAQEKKDEQQKFNILYSNTETIVPAIYNSPPAPDVRRRYGDDDPDAKAVSDAIERCISYAVDNGDFDNAIKFDVMDMALPGRGVSRVQYEPLMGPPDPMTGQPSIVYQQMKLQHVQWDDFRHGPAKTWDAVPWIAFKHMMTREQLVQLSPQFGPTIKLDASIEGYNSDKQDNPPDVFKRAVVWEIWDKEQKTILFLAESFKDSVLAQMPPPFTSENFYPIPKPLRALERSDSLVPTDLYKLYENQAGELDSITSRIGKLIKVLRWRGIRSKALGDAFEKIKDLDDGQLAPADNAMEVMQSQGSLESGVWLMPIDKLIVVIKELVLQREQIKAVIYEITGIADIMRGATNANETLGAQQIKTQWGTLRIQDFQKAVQNYARSIFRIMAEIIADQFTPQVIQMMTGIQLTPQQISLLKNDVLRQYRVDVETDSTIRADVSRQQQNISQFIQGIGSFVQSVGPLVQQGAMPPDVAIEMMVSFSRVFKLGRQVENSLDNWKQKTVQMLQNPPPPKPDPEMVKQQAEMARIQLESETKIIVAAITAASDSNSAPKTDAMGNPLPQQAQPNMSNLTALVIQKLEQVFGGMQPQAAPMPGNPAINPQVQQPQVAPLNPQTPALGRA